MDDTPQPVDAKTLKFLRRLVTLLTATMIIGLLVIIALFVIKFSDLRRAPAGRLALPDDIVLPAGATARAFTRGDSWFAVVTDDDRILIYDPSSGALVQQVRIAIPD